MKKCPNCNQVFSDDNFFCLNDGTTLILAPQTSENPPVFPTPGNAPTQVLARPQTQKVSDSSKWLYLIIGVMATTIIALAAAFYFSRSTNEKVATSKSIEETVNKTIEEKSTIAQNTFTTENSQSQPIVKNANTILSTPRPMPSINPNLNPGGRWSGDWNSKTAYYTAEMSLTDNGTGKFSGEIYWNLIRTTTPKKIDKIGSTATEYVQGTFNPATRNLNLKGYRKDDPNNIVILDRYNLSLSEDNQTITGKSINGKLVLRR